MFFPIRIEKIKAIPAVLVACLAGLSIIVHVLPTLVGDPNITDALINDSKRWNYALLTGALVHVDVPHLAVNLVYLYFYGNLICRVLGNGVFLLLVVTTTVLTGLIDISMRETSIGLSAAISGLMGTALMTDPARRVHFLYLFGFSNGTFSLPLMWVTGIGVFLDLTGLLYYVTESRYFDNTAYWDHLAGFTLGCVVGYVGIRDRLITRRENRSPTIIDIIERPDTRILSKSRSVKNRAIVDTWVLFILIVSALKCYGVYWFVQQSIEKSAELSEHWIVLTYLALTPVVALLVYFRGTMAFYVALVFVVSTAVINFAHGWDLSLRIEQLVVFLFLFQATTEKIYWPRIFKYARKRGKPGSEQGSEHSFR